MSGAGAEFFYPDGRLKQSHTDYAGGFYGSFATGGAASGSIQDVRLVGKLLLAFPLYSSGNFGGPNLSLDSNTGIISWSFTASATNGASTGAPPNQTIIYGGY
jgi:hypothetical protein